MTQPVGAKPVDAEFTERMLARLKRAERLWMFLDYDGTLAPFAPTPDIIEPDPELKDLLNALAEHPSIRISVVSGRRLAHVEDLLPVDGILMAGTYGVELRTDEGEQLNQVEHTVIRPVLEALKPHWKVLVEENEGFFLEDKGWALAIHGKDATDEDSERVLAAAKALIDENLTNKHFRILNEYKFLEIGPRLAHKGMTIDYLLERYPLPGAHLLYIGDDDRDEEAFAVIHQNGGLAIRVTNQPEETSADYTFSRPSEVREWLWRLAGSVERSEP